MRMLSRITRALLGLVLALFVITAPAAVAVAAEPVITVHQVAALAAPAVAFTFDTTAFVQLLVAFVLPVLVGLVTTRVVSAAAKAWLLAALTLLTSLLAELARALASGATFDAGVALLVALPAFVVSVASHYGLWKPTGISAAAQDFGTGRHAAP